MVVTGVVPSPPRFLPSIFFAHRVQQSHCSSIFHRMLLTHALALSASQFVRTEKSPRVYTRIYALGGIRTHETDLHQAGGYNLIRHRGDRLVPGISQCFDLHLDRTAPTFLEIVKRAFIRTAKFVVRSQVICLHIQGSAVLEAVTLLSTNQTHRVYC